MYQVQLETVGHASTAVSRDRFGQQNSSTAAAVTTAAAAAASPQTETLPVHRAKGGISWAECVFQIFCSIQGPTFFVLPAGFKDVGYALGMGGAFGVAIFYIYMMRLYLWCETELRRRHNIAENARLSIYSLVELTFVGSPHQRRVATLLNAYLKYEIVLSWSLSLSFAQLFVCQNVRLIIEYLGYTTSNRTILLTLFPVTTFASWVPNLKVMSSIAYLSSLTTVLVMFHIIYLVVTDAAPLSHPQAIGDVSCLPTFVGTVFFTIVATPLLLPLKNQMKNPRWFGGMAGSFTSAIAIVVVLNVAFSLFGYVKYGQQTSDNMLRNLPANGVTMLSNGLLTATMIGGSAISFYVVFETIWNERLRSLCANLAYVRLYEYTARTALNLAITLVPLLVPTCTIFVNLISSFSYPYDSIFVPILLQGTLLWRRDERGPCFFAVMALNGVILVASIIFSIVSLVTCTSELIRYYS